MGEDIILGSGQLFMQADGEYVPIAKELKEVYIEKVDDQKEVAAFEHIKNEPHTMTFECSNVIINWRVLNKFLSLPTTNNYLKMHGGVMHRKGTNKRKIENLLKTK